MKPRIENYRRVISVGTTEADVSFFPQGAVEEYQRFHSELTTQTDRGAALLGAAFLEWRVRQTVKSRFRCWGKSLDSVFGTDEKGGTLGFTDQCRIAYGLGLVGEVGLGDLERIARIRNRFAHHLSIDSFGHDKIKGACASLRSPGVVSEFFHQSNPDHPLNAPTDPRERYINTVFLVNSILWSSAVRKQVEWKDDDDAIFW